MALTKTDMIENIAKAGFTKEKSILVTDALIEIIKRTLAAGEDVMVSGFGRFCVNEKGARAGRNPATGESMLIAERKIVTFRCSVILKDRVGNHQLPKKKKITMKTQEALPSRASRAH
ncbi:integration host factor subunit alpha [Desulforegula conservatrix]|uniref:integration host factor subunit alpha n=1 Tax=Desulforegula conservatrix TaxID=153026 RepID=UPI000402951E